MNKIRFSCVLAIVVAPMLTHCVATEQDVKSLDLRLRSVDNRLIDAEHNLADLNKLQSGTVQNMQMRQAEVGNKTDQINAELAQLKGQIEETTFDYRSLRQQNENLKSQYDKRIAEMEDRINNLAAKLEQTTGQLNETSQNLVAARTQLQDTEEQLTALKEKRAQEAADKALAAAAAAQEARQKAKDENRMREITPEQSKKKPEEGTAEKPVASKAKSSDEKGYNDAMELFQKKDYKKAYAAFASFLEGHPKSDLAPNARFWMGDCLYNQKEYELAILEYQKVIAEYPSHPKAPAALLKQALAFEELKDPDTAKIIYQKLTVEYPDSEQAAVAKKKI